LRSFTFGFTQRRGDAEKAYCNESPRSLRLRVKMKLLNLHEYNKYRTIAG